MISKFYGPYDYSKTVVENWKHALKGVYYCGNGSGQVANNYIGKATGIAGIRGRLLDHLDQDYWPDVVHFWYRTCDTDREVDQLEILEIKRHQPKYNTQHV